MPHYNPQDDIYASNSHFLSPAATSSRKSHQNLKAHRSTASLRDKKISPLSHVMDMDDDASSGRHHSLAHELAVALMPEPSAGSKLLAEEFGIEYDEGAEGIDEASTSAGHQFSDNHHLNGAEFASSDADVPSLASEFGTSASDASFHDLGTPSAAADANESFRQDDEHGFGYDDDPVFSSPTVSSRRKMHQKKPEQDAMEVLAQDLESTDIFLNHLRTIDVDAPSSASSSSKHQQQPMLERLASDVIRRMNETVRDREGQVRELLECEREFRRIAGEVGGGDVLGQLEELENVEDLSDRPPSRSHTLAASKTESRHLDPVVEDDHNLRRRRQHRRNTSDWELDPDRHHLGDHDDNASEPATSPIKDSFPPPPALVGPPTPASTVPQLAHLRTFTTSLVSSLTTISEQAQVNSAATTEAGRKIRALKNKLGGWRTDWDSAERSRMRIERWEAGIPEGFGEEGEEESMPTSPGRSMVASATAKRIDGRRVVEEHLRAFERALADAAVKTQAIMAR